MNCQFRIADGFKTSFKVCKASFTNFKLIFDGRLELGWRRSLDRLRLTALGQRQLIRFQFFNTFDVTLLFWDTQISSDRATCGNLDRGLTDSLSLTVDGFDGVHACIFGAQVHYIQCHVPV